MENHRKSVSKSKNHGKISLFRVPKIRNCRFLQKLVVFCEFLGICNAKNYEFYEIYQINGPDQYCVYIINLKLPICNSRVIDLFFDHVFF